MREEDFGKKIHLISKALKCNLDRKVEAYGVTAVQSRIIRYVGTVSQKRDVYQKDIEEAFDIRRSSVTNVLQILEKNGYITRESVASDARLKKLVLTERGQQVNVAVYQTILSEEKKVLSSLTEEEIEAFYSTLDKLAVAALELEGRGGNL